MSNVRDFGAVGDGKTDDTQAIRHAIFDGDGLIEFPRGEYLITETLEIPLGTVKSRLHHAVRMLRDDPRTRRFFEE